MISRDQIRRLIERPAGDLPVLSVFLDMSVTSNNKRTHQVFLNKEKGSHPELDSDRNGNREQLGQAFARLQAWLDGRFDEANKGVAAYLEIGGDWLETHQFPVPIGNRVIIDDRPVVGPLLEVLQRYRHHGVLLVDRERLRLLSFYLDETLHDEEIRTDPIAAPHDIKRGGFSAPDYQARKAEETRHFFREFVAEVQDFVRRFTPDDLTVLGTHENVMQFIEYLPAATRALIARTERIEIDATAPEIWRKLEPAFRRSVEEEEAHAINVLRERIKGSHLAVAGLEQTLEQLQEGKIETLIVARGAQLRGGRCQQCQFLLASDATPCPYCGGQVRDGIDLSEEMLRLAGDQAVDVDFVGPGGVDEFGGVGALLRF